MKIPKLSKKRLVVFAAILTIAVVCAVAYAWIASNVLYFQTTLVGNPFTLSIVSSYSSPVPLSPPYLPATLHYGEPVVLETITNNTANSGYNNVYTAYEIWESGGPSLTVAAESYITVTVQNVASTSPYNAVGSPTTLSFSLYTDAALSGNANNALVAYIGPYNVPAAPWSAYANVTVTFNPGAPLTTYGANVWVAVS